MAYHKKTDSDKYLLPALIMIVVVMIVTVGIWVYNPFQKNGLADSVKKMTPVTQNESDKVIEEKKSKYVCENDKLVNSTVYIFIHPFQSHNPNVFKYQKDLLKDNHNVVGILIFDYDEKLLLEEISNQFVDEFNQFVKENNPQEIVIIGRSTGGVIASYSAHKLIFDGDIELHTIASPLNGYGAKGLKEHFLGNLSGFGREIAVGFDSFNPPPVDMRVYHHKTVDDVALTDLCGPLPCDAVKIQNNNLQGSKELFYPEQDHFSLVPIVSNMVISCRQKN